MNDRMLPMIRNYRPGDEKAWLELIRACPDFAQSFFNRSASLDALRVVIEHPQMDAVHNLFFAEARGQFVGYAELWCATRSGPTARTVGRLLVHPNWRRRGLGTMLLARIEPRARAEGGSYLDIMAAEQHHAGRQFLGALGFTIVHYGWQMALPEIDAAPLPEWPASYGTRTFLPGQDECTSVQLENESFQDEWEYVRVELGEIQRFVRSPSFRADGVIYAVHEGQVVGECWNWIDNDRIGQCGEKRGDIWCLCVHPQHRRRGLGRALLLAGVQWLHRQGMTSAHLTVDGANERAKHLYESVGFVTQRTNIWYRRRLRV
jgi:mycothiol synthase